MRPPDRPLRPGARPTYRAPTAGATRAGDACVKGAPRPRASRGPCAQPPSFMVPVWFVRWQRAGRLQSLSTVFHAGSARRASTHPRRGGGAAARATDGWGLARDGQRPPAAAAAPARTPTRGARANVALCTLRHHPPHTLAPLLRHGALSLPGSSLFPLRFLAHGGGQGGGPAAGRGGWGTDPRGRQAQPLPMGGGSCVMHGRPRPRGRLPPRPTRRGGPPLPPGRRGSPRGWRGRPLCGSFLLETRAGARRRPAVSVGSRREARAAPPVAAGRLLAVWGRPYGRHY